MRILIVGDGTAAASLHEGLEASDLQLDHRPDGPAIGEGEPEIAAIARELREFERVLDEDGADGVLVASDSPAALAAVIVATKLRTPVARLDPLEHGEEAGTNARLIGELSDARLAPDPATIMDWARGGYPGSP